MTGPLRRRRARFPAPDLGETGVWIPRSLQCYVISEVYGACRTLNFNIHRDITDWLDKEFGPVGYSFIAGPSGTGAEGKVGIRFLTVTDAVHFKLRWGDL